MQDFSYYETPNLPYCGYEQAESYKVSLRATIDNSPMTAIERKTALDGLAKQVRKYCLERNAPYNAATMALDEEFWRDCREELGYDKFLDEHGCEILEGKAWEDEHSSGYESVYSELMNLSAFAEEILRHQIFTTHKMI